MHCNVALVVHYSFALVVHCNFALVIASGCIAMSALIAAALALTCLCLHAVQRGATNDDNNNDDDDDNSITFFGEKKIAECSKAFRKNL